MFKLSDELESVCRFPLWWKKNNRWIVHFILLAFDLLKQFMFAARQQDSFNVYFEHSWGMQKAACAMSHVGCFVSFMLVIFGALVSMQFICCMIFFYLFILHTENDGIALWPMWPLMRYKTFPRDNGLWCHSVTHSCENIRSCPTLMSK